MSVLEGLRERLAALDEAPRAVVVAEREGLLDRLVGEGVLIRPQPGFLAAR
jgi:hypothetical protein